MTNSVRTTLAVAALLFTFGSAAFAQGVSVDTRTRGSGAVGVGPGGLGGSVSGANRVGGHVTAPGAGVGINSHTSGQGTAGVGGGRIGGKGGASGKARDSIRLGR